MNFRFGALRSPHDTRDLVAEHIYPKSRDLALPEELDLRKDLQPIRDQGQQGSCVAQACACMKEWHEKKQVGLNQYMSPQFIYNNRSNYPEEGMYGRDAMQILYYKGSCLEKTYPYGIIEEADNLNKKAVDEATRYRIMRYAKVNTIDGVKSALYKNGPCVILFPVHNYSPQFWKQANPSEPMLGGHAVNCCGYLKDGFVIRNSWGTDWGDNGYTLYPYSDFGLHWEIWTTVDDNSPLPDVLIEPKEPKETPGCFNKLFKKNKN